MTVWYVIAGILVLVGLAGTILPALPALGVLPAIAAPAALLRIRAQWECHQ